MQEFRAKGYRIIAPPLPILLASENGQIVPSKYAIAARVAGLEIITWTLERSGRINEEVVPNKTSITRHSFRPSRRTRRCRTMEPSCWCSMSSPGRSGSSASSPTGQRLRRLRQLHEPVAWQAGPADVLVAFAGRVQIGELRVCGTLGKPGVWL